MGNVDGAVEAQGEGFVERARRCGAELCGQPYLHLRLGDWGFARRRRRRRWARRLFNGRICANQDAGALQLVERSREGPGDGVDVRLGVRGRQEAGKALLDVDALQPHQRVEQAREPILRAQV